MQKAGVAILEAKMFAQTESSIDHRETSSLVLAYIGDAVYELATREHLINKGITNMNKLHHEAVKHVRASAQAKVFRALAEHLSEAETIVARRGRNAKSGHGAKGDSILEYRQSTGFESLIGYLYLRREWPRLDEIISLTWRIIGEEIDDG